MVVLYGLGNNEQKYLETKHNLGRKVLELLAKDLNLNFSNQKTWADTSFKTANQKVYLLHSLGYMNQSGEVLKNFFEYYKLNFEKAGEESILCILQDDSDQISGKAKLALAGGSAGHRGINDIYKYLPSIKCPLETVWRIKLGIRPKNNKLRSETFVLKSITDIDKKLAIYVKNNIKEHLKNFSLNSFSILQNKINSQIL